METLFTVGLFQPCLKQSGNLIYCYTPAIPVEEAVKKRSVRKRSTNTGADDYLNGDRDYYLGIVFDGLDVSISPDL